MSEIVLVRNLDPVLIQSHGTFHHYGIDKALRGEREGKWVIVREKEKDTYEDKEAVSQKDESYLTKAEFRKPRRGLSFKDLYGEKKRK